MDMQEVLVPKPPVVVFFTQVTSLFGFTTLQELGGKVDENPSDSGGFVGELTTTLMVLALDVQAEAATVQE
jgi:hypothetical protein